MRFLLYLFSPTCQVRVVRFYHSCSPPPRLAFSSCSSCSSSASISTTSASTSTSTVALPTLRQALCQRPSSVCTAGPQPGTFPAQWAPLDLNLGPSQLSGHRWTSTWPAQLSVHRWTSTWDLPSSVCTAGPQPGTCPVCTAGPQWPDRMPEDMPDIMSDRMPEDMPDKMP